jgi:hypothetical protein
MPTRTPPLLTGATMEPSRPSDRRAAAALAGPLRRLRPWRAPCSWRRVNSMTCPKLKSSSARTREPKCAPAGGHKTPLTTSSTRAACPCPIHFATMLMACWKCPRLRPKMQSTLFWPRQSRSTTRGLSPCSIFSDNSIKAYQQSVCPANGSKNTRYGSIKGYGYSTSKCVCYTDGSGCDCDKQNEGKAVRNVATYGPAVVCLDASTWQDYTDGILTSASGCSQQFMDVNHCVQAVGYAYVSEDESKGNSRDNSKDNKNGGKRLLKSNDNNSKSGSKDKESRQGYWIVRNQWSSYWGMNGYAYVAMGANTCGILNDMLQAYT